MKKLLTLTLVAAALGLAASSQAQLTVSNVLSDTGEFILTNGIAAFEGSSLTNGLNAAPFGLYHQGDWGVGVAVSTASTNAFNYGVAFAAIQENTPNQGKQWNFYETAVTLEYDGQADLPLVGKCSYTIQTGGMVNLRQIQQGVWNEDQVILHKDIDLYAKNIYLGGWAGSGYAQRWNGGFVAFGLALTDLMQGKGFMGLW